jgi:multiple sugar transport system permease protein
MPFARVMRGLLILLLALAMLWAVWTVGQRTLADWQTQADHELTLTLLHWGGSEEVAIVEDLIARFEAKHPRLAVHRIHASDYNTKIQTMFAAGDPPDLFYLQHQQMPKFLQGPQGPASNLVKNLDPFLKRERDRGQGQWLEDYYPKLLNAFRWNPQRQRTGAGSLFGLPKDFTTMVMFVNVDLFKQAGVAVPYDGWTWQEFVETTRQIAKVKPESGQTRIYGGALKTFPKVLRNMTWTFGGSFFGEGPDQFRDVRLDAPASQEALRFIRRLRLEEPAIYNPTGISRNADSMFLAGRLGVLGPLGRWKVPLYRQIETFEWDIVPLPHRAGHPPAASITAVAWAMSARTEHPEASWQLLKFLAGRPGQQRRAELGLAIPAMRSIAEAELTGPAQQPPRHSEVFLKAYEHARIAQPAPYTAFTRILGDEMEDALRLGQSTPAAAATRVERRWQQFLDSPRRGESYPSMPWQPIVAATVALGLAVLGGFSLWVMRSNGHVAPRHEARAGWLLISPWLLAFFLFIGGPVVLALILSAAQWSALEPLRYATFAGLDNFRHLFTRDDRFYQAVEVTVYFTVLFLPLSQVLALGLAMLMNQRVRGIGLFRTVNLMPGAVTGVVLATIWLTMFNNETGFINSALNLLLAPVGLSAPDWFGADANVAAVPALVIMGLWGVGTGAIIYLAGLQKIPPQLYEAARLEGASAGRQFTRITLPMLSPIIFFNVIMALIVSFHFFTQAYVIDNLTGGTNEHVLLMVLYIYKAAFVSHQVGYASALAVVLFAALLVLTGALFWAGRHLVYYEGVRL